MQTNMGDFTGEKGHVAYAAYKLLDIYEQCSYEQKKTTVQSKYWLDRACHSNVLFTKKRPLRSERDMLVTGRFVHRLFKFDLRSLA